MIGLTLPAVPRSMCSCICLQPQLITEGCFDGGVDDRGGVGRDARVIGPHCLRPEKLEGA